LRMGKTERAMKLEDFFIAYGKQDRKLGELVWRIDVPKPKANQTFHCAKITKRRDDDISAVMGAFLFTVEKEKITTARIAYGGMAGTPKRASKTEAALIGKTLQEAKHIVLDDYEPLSDMRASAEYRASAANALLQKALMQAAGETDLQVHL
jgi:xanthine dehydrogenase small subunit